MSTLVVGLLEVAPRLGLVVQAEDGGGGPAAQDLAAGLEPGLEGGEAERPPFLGRGQRMDAQAGLGDHAQRALAPDEQLGQVGPGGGAGPLPSVCTMRPSARTTSSPSTMSSIFP